MAPHDRSAFIAQVTKVYSQRMTCDLKTHDGQLLHNIPVMTSAGTIDGAPYGTVSLPANKDYVVVIYASYGTRHKVIVGTVIPYLAPEFGKAPVNSENKQFATTMLEENKPLEDKYIFKSGTSLLVEEDGTISIETPSGMFIHIDEANSKIIVSDAQGTPNVLTLSSTGILIEDKNGNDITMTSGKVTINGNLEVLI
jgi:hypothetical protein